MLNCKYYQHNQIQNLNKTKQKNKIKFFGLGIKVIANITNFEDEQSIDH